MNDPEGSDQVRTGAVQGEITLKAVYSKERLTRIIKRGTNYRDGRSLVEPLLRVALLREFGGEIAAAIAEDVVAGAWKPEPAYVCTIGKGEYGFRELSFPGLVDEIVARAAIDALETDITRDDGDYAFCTRSHASSNRKYGDYDHWFAVWRDYSAAIAEACEREGYAFVYNTDVTDFFPSVSRDAAKKELARRTAASPELLELLFYILETWLPRVAYAPLSGLPLDDKDVSRLVAHNYLKQVDEEILRQLPVGARYLRFVDDAVFIVKTEKEAQDTVRIHHRALRAVGLNPSAAKSHIFDTQRFQAQRHREVNLQLDEAKTTKSSSLLGDIAREWHASDRERPGWERVSQRIFSVGLQISDWSLDAYAVADIRHAKDARLVDMVFRYLKAHSFSLHREILDTLLDACMRPQHGCERAIAAAGFLADGCFPPAWTSHLAAVCIGRIKHDFNTPGIGYVKALLVLAGYKYGRGSFRQELASWVDQHPVRNAADVHLRSAYLFCMACHSELDEGHRRALLADTTRDTHLTLRLADSAVQGTINIERLYGHMTQRLDAGFSLQARYLPLLFAVSSSTRLSGGFDEQARRWLEGKRRVLDPTVRKHLEDGRARFQS